MNKTNLSLILSALAFPIGAAAALAVAATLASLLIGQSRRQPP